MSQSSKIDINAKGTVCRCCGEELESEQGNQICGPCTRQGCDPDTTLCLRDMGVQ